MAWDSERNRIYSERLRAMAVAFQNLAEEAARMRTVFTQELQAGNPAFVNTPI